MHTVLFINNVYISTDNNQRDRIESNIYGIIQTLILALQPKN
jgi:hypothetical protein